MGRRLTNRDGFIEALVFRRLVTPLALRFVKCLALLVFSCAPAELATHSAKEPIATRMQRLTIAKAPHWHFVRNGEGRAIKICALCARSAPLSFFAKRTDFLPTSMLHSNSVCLSALLPKAAIRPLVRPHDFCLRDLG